MLTTVQTHIDACDVTWPVLPKNGQRLFVKTDYLSRYSTFAHTYEPHILVTTASDYSPSTYMTEVNVRTFLENDNIIAWYAQNTITKHPKMKHIPIGLKDDPEVLAFCAKYGEDLRALPKKDEVYSNFTDDTNPKERETFYTKNKSEPFEDYMRTMAGFKYVLCPMGNGIDTHRFWEAQVCGCIPIIRCPVNFLPTYAHVPYICLPGVCCARLGAADRTLHTESIFRINVPDGTPPISVPDTPHPPIGWRRKQAFSTFSVPGCDNGPT